MIYLRFLLFTYLWFSAQNLIACSALPSNSLPSTASLRHRLRSRYTLYIDESGDFESQKGEWLVVRHFDVRFFFRLNTWFTIDGPKIRKGIFDGGLFFDISFPLP